VAAGISEIAFDRSGFKYHGRGRSADSAQNMA
jgi:ribosomal protein L18